MGKTFSLSVMFLSCLLISCTQDATLQKQLKEMESRAEGNDNTISELQTEITTLQYRLDALEDTEAELNLTEKQYSLVKSNVGNLLVVVNDIKPYSDGQKISILVGNPYNMTFDGYTIKIRYSRRWPLSPKGNDPEKRKIWRSELEKYNESQKQKEVVITEKLLPGRWNKATIVLAPAKAEEIGSIRIKILANQVMLYGGR